jgi:asparagine synthase (glutamine-hydrolysing)
MVEKLRGYTLDILSKEKLRRHGLLNQNVVNSLVQAYHSGERRQAGRVWNLMMFQVWWERYFG